MEEEHNTGDTEDKKMTMLDWERKKETDRKQKD